MSAAAAVDPADHASSFLRCMLELDISGMRKLYAHTHPHLQGGSDTQVLVALHMARTMADNVSIKMRQYSHAWLVAGGHHSSLPDHLKPKGEQVRPRVVPATGFAMMFGSKILKPLIPHVEGKVHEVILDAYATDKVHKIDHDKLRAGMLETKDAEIHSLVGSIAALRK